MILTNHSVLQQKYLETSAIQCITISSVSISPFSHTQLVESIKDKYPTLGDHLNVASIEAGEHPVSETAPVNPFEAVLFRFERNK